MSEEGEQGLTIHEIIDHVYSINEGKRKLFYGTARNALFRMERMRYVKMTWELRKTKRGNRHMWEVTILPAGMDALQEELKMVASQFSFVLAVRNVDMLNIRRRKAA